MYITPDKFLNASKTGVEATLALVQAQMATFEKVTALNVQNAKSTFEDAADHLRTVIAAKDPQELMQLNAAYAQPSIEKAVGYARSVYDVTAQAQANFVKVLDAQTSEVNKAFGTAIDTMSKNAPVGSEAAVNAIKSTLAAFNAAYDGVSKVAKQTAQVIDQQVANAAQATRYTAKRKG